jgi:hypothetical protein
MSYTHELAEKLGHIRPDERLQFQAALKVVDEEEARMARLFASGKITDSVWDNLWAEWQDRRNKLRLNLELVEQEREIHINNVVVNSGGAILLELRTPFAYLRDLTDEICNMNCSEDTRPQMKIGGHFSADPRLECSK